MPRLKDTYKAELVPAMMQKFEYKNVNQVPKLEKVVINMGLGEAKDNPKALDSAVEDLTVIAGQKPVVTYAKKSVANFKLREGMKIGAKVTLRMSLLISSSALQSRVCVTSEDFPQNPLTAGAILLWVSRSSLCSLKSSTIR